MDTLKKNKLLMMSKISASIVLHNTDKEELNEVINSCVNSSISVDIFLIDNSPNNNLNFLKNDNRLNYLKVKNNGFGAGHNEAIIKNKLIENYDYHIVINPDISFDKGVIKNIFSYMEKNNNIGVVMPRILNIDNSLQYARRLLPSPLDIFTKRFFKNLLSKSNYEMTNLEPNKPVEIIALCGCFLFFRTKALKDVGLFDERYFMYFEDFDLCRRISDKYKTVYYPYCEVIHKANREHRRNLKLFFLSIRSTLSYFNKWGYYDKKKIKLNQATMTKVIKSCNN
jgi:GT2 family glycosyltransferase